MGKQHWAVEMSKILKERDNKAKIGPVLGRVVSNAPVKISILDGKVFLEKESLYLCDGSSTFGYLNGDEVLLMPAESEQVFFIIGKAIKL